MQGRRSKADLHRCAGARFVFVRSAHSRTDNDQKLSASVLPGAGILGRAEAVIAELALDEAIARTLEETILHEHFVSAITVSVELEARIAFVEAGFVALIKARHIRVDFDECPRAARTA